MNIQSLESDTIVYKGEYGNFTINDGDRQEVIIYRLSLFLASFSFAMGTVLILWKGANENVLDTLTPLFAIFALSLIISLSTIHIYLAFLHNLLKIFWLIGTISAIIINLKSDQSLVLFIYENPLNLLGIGFIFAALTGIYFKEGICFNRLETKILTILVPFLLLGHLLGFLPLLIEKILLASWALLFIVFALRKFTQAIPSDIGDKSVFAYLKSKK